MRRGFTGIFLLMAFIIGVGIVGTVMTPNMRSYFDGKKVEAAIAKERIIKETFLSYSESNTSIKNIQELYEYAKADRLIPYETLSAFTSNGLGGEFSIDIDGAVLEITSVVNGSYAKALYLSEIIPSATSFEKEGKVGHRYFLGGNLMTMMRGTGKPSVEHAGHALGKKWVEDEYTYIPSRQAQIQNGHKNDNVEPETKWGGVKW